MKFRLSNSSVIWMKWSKQRTKSKMNSDAMPCSEHLEPYLISNNSLIHFQRITLIFNSRDKSHSAATSFWDDILCLIIVGRPHEKDGNILIYLLKGIFQTNELNHYAYSTLENSIFTSDSINVKFFTYVSPCPIILPSTSFANNEIKLIISTS